MFDLYFTILCWDRFDKLRFFDKSITQLLDLTIYFRRKGMRNETSSAGSATLGDTC